MTFRIVLFLALLLFTCQPKDPPLGKGSLIEATGHGDLKSINRVSGGNQVIAIENVTLIDGTGAGPEQGITVLVENQVIKEIAGSESISIPNNVEIISGQDLFLMPGLIDAHFHLDQHKNFPRLFLRNGVTSMRDPGAWIESYEPVMASDDQIPRLYLTGPHLDQPPPAYPRNSYLIRDRIEARDAVNLFADQGASAIKVYFRLPPEIIEAVCATAHKRGIPVVAHLEVTSATAAIKAGVDGIEHITSFGIDLLPPREAEQYRQTVLANNNARRNGRYRVWEQIDLSSPRVDSLLQLLKRHGTVVTPTLGAFEHQLRLDTMSVREAFRLGYPSTSNTGIDSVKVRAFENMKTFTGMVHRAGIPVVVGSHSWVRYQKDVGLAFQREMELLSQCGLTNMEIILAATRTNAKFLRINQGLGTIEVGKTADLLLLEENPLRDISAFYKINRVMLNGKWVD